ncbi:MAG: DUF2330 domain-containing protein [Polyangiaceae bacterium]
MGRALAWLALLGALTLSRRAPCCAPAPPAGERVTTERESALIVWEPDARREHFVRSAVFGSSSKAFGFLVPTPSKPELGEVDDRIFESLRRLTAPAEVSKTELDWVPIGCTALPFTLLLARSSKSLDDSRLAASVSVLEQKRVAGLDATVLEASNADALVNWLGARGFAFRAELKDWVAPYLSRGWKITAFRYAPDANAAPSEQLATRALRMSFSTDVPVYPYREPLDQPSVPGRQLQLFVLASEALRAELDSEPQAWRGELRFAAPTQLDAPLRAAVPNVLLPSSAWLHEFVDASDKRVNADLLFEKSADAREVRPEPVVRVRTLSVPVFYELPLLFGGVWWWHKRRRRESARANADVR